jgi:outer membrane protein, heavy metal efflux system
MRRGMLCVIAWLLVVAPAGAQPRIVDPANGSTIAALVERAIAGEPSLQAARLAVEAAEARVRQAELRPNPTISATHEQASGMDARTMASVAWPLDLGRRAARVEAAGRERAVAELDVAERRRQLAANIAETATTALSAARRAAIAEEHHAAAGRFAGLVDARVKEGATPEIEREYATIELRRIETEHLAAIADLEEALVRLRATVGDQRATPILLRNDLEHEAAAPDPSSPPDVDQHVAVRRARAETELISARIDTARADAGWNADVMASYSRMSMGFRQLGMTASGGTVPIQGTFNMLGGGMTLNWPLRNRNQGEIAALDAELRAAQALEQRTRLSAAADIDAARVRITRAREALEIFRSGVREPARRALEVLREAYQLGRTPLLDVLAEQRRVLEIEHEYTQALEHVVRARVALERAIGVMP